MFLLPFLVLLLLFVYSFKYVRKCVFRDGTNNPRAKLEEVKVIVDCPLVSVDDPKRMIGIP